jgi:hypothetical protein
MASHHTKGHEMLGDDVSPRALLPLAALTFAVALATSRYGLVIHEFAGHGGAAVALGGHVDAVRLFWFGGGWVSYHLPADPAAPGAAEVAVTLAGIATEWIAAAVLVVIARRRTGLARLAAIGAAAGFAIHGGLYLSIGTFYGSGDGTLLYRLLGAWRPLVWAPAGALCITVAWLGGRAVAPLLRARAPGRQLAVIGAALALGGAANVGLLLGERALRADATYVAIMKTEGQRTVEHDVAAAQAARATPAQIEAVRRASEERNRPFPLAPILIALVAAAAIAAFAASRPEAAPTPLAWREVAPYALVAAAGVALVALIDAIA